VSEPLEIHVISDSTGETAARFAEAVERQFPDEEFEIVRHPRMTSVDDVQLAAARARGRRAVLMYTLVDNEFRDAMRTLCRRYRLHYCDLLGHPIDAVARVSGQPATMTPGGQPVLDSSYFKRIEAIEFAVRFDDGVGPGGLKDADIVLVGVSRSSKTPLSIYLGYLGYKTANVPIVPGVEPPRELEEIDPRTIVGLTIDAESLAEALAAAADTEEFEQAYVAYDRANRLAGKSDGAAAELDPRLATDDAELALIDAVAGASPKIAAALEAREYDDALAAAAELRAPVDRFFDEVLVMADDAQVRANRLRLLLDVRDAVGALGDLAQIPR